MRPASVKMKRWTLQGALPVAAFSAYHPFCGALCVACWFLGGLESENEAARWAGSGRSLLRRVRLALSVALVILCAAFFLERHFLTVHGARILFDTAAGCLAQTAAAQALMQPVSAAAAGRAAVGFAVLSLGFACL